MSRQPHEQPGIAWCAVALVLLAGSLVTHGPLARSVLEWRPDALTDTPWRAWSAAFVHYSQLHLIGNLAGLALTAAFGWVARVPTSAAVAWALAWPLTHVLFLWLAPEMRHYGGLSGVVHAGVAVGLVHLFLTGTRSQRLIAAALCAGLLAKLMTETPWRGAVQQQEGWDIAIAPIAHVTGVLAGATLALLAHVLRRLALPAAP